MEDEATHQRKSQSDGGIKMQEIIDIVFSTSFLFSVIRISTPLIFGTLAAIISNKAGVINIGIEGLMLFGALFGVIGSAYTQNVYIGVLLGVMVGVSIAIIMSYFVVNLQTDVILVGIANNLFASGTTIFILYMLTGDKGISLSLKSLVLPSIELPIISQIPILGSWLSGHNVMTYIAFIFVYIMYIVIYKTKIGLQIRATGENEEAAKSVGINVGRIKYISFIFSGFLSALGGIYLSMGYVSWFSKDMTAGRGFIALAAEALGQGTPLGGMLASLVFATTEALSNGMQVMDIPSQLVYMIPYASTIFGLIIYSMMKTKAK